VESVPAQPKSQKHHHSYHQAFPSLPLKNSNTEESPANDSPTKSHPAKPKIPLLKKIEPDAGEGLGC
jgi:hypothetical protein